MSSSRPMWGVAPEAGPQTCSTFDACLATKYALVVLFHRNCIDRWLDRGLVACGKRGAMERINKWAAALKSDEAAAPPWQPLQTQNCLATCLTHSPTRPAASLEQHVELWRSNPRRGKLLLPRERRPSRVGHRCPPLAASGLPPRGGSLGSNQLGGDAAPPAALGRSGGLCLEDLPSSFSCWMNLGHEPELSPSPHIILGALRQPAGGGRGGLGAGNAAGPAPGEPAAVVGRPADGPPA